MSDIRIHRRHELGLAKARAVARQWTEEATRTFDMKCTAIEGEARDTVEFVRPGVQGRLTVSADHFDVEATLGLLLGAFSQRIESEIEHQLDALLATASKSKPAAQKAAARRGAKK